MESTVIITTIAKQKAMETEGYHRNDRGRVKKMLFLIKKF